MASATPISVAVSRPDSGCETLDTANAATTIIRASGLSKKSGTH